ncbi:MAG: prephenate dehydrogenase/arogenate dehydrogenase family protein [Bellilinea sp.]|jgi:prephenate dehydrogenase
MTLQVTVIGLSQVGVSIGLALQNAKEQFVRVGSDIDIIAEQKALRLKAFDRIVHNLPAAVEKADVVVLCLPVDEIKAALEVIAPYLKPGAVLLDTSPLILAVHNWAKNILPAERYLVSLTPSLNPQVLTDADETLDKASTQFFQQGLILITAPPETHASALKLAGEFAVLLGGKAYFADSFEADGLLAMVSILPKLAAAGLMRAVINQPGWREGKKIAGQAFLTATEPLLHLDERKTLGQTAIHNSGNAVRLLDALIGELEDFREMLLNQDDQALHEAISTAQQQRILWWQERQEALWESRNAISALPDSRQFLGRLFGLGKRSRREDKGKK